MWVSASECNGNSIWNISLLNIMEQLFFNTISMNCSGGIIKSGRLSIRYIKNILRYLLSLVFDFTCKLQVDGDEAVGQVR